MFHCFNWLRCNTLGLTPFQLAAHKNDYVMLRILHEYGYGWVATVTWFISCLPFMSSTKIQIFSSILPESQQRAFSKLSEQSSLNDPDDSVLDRAWDASNHQLLYYRAIASPSYQILTFGQGLESKQNATELVLIKLPCDLFQLTQEIGISSTIFSACTEI